MEYSVEIRQKCILQVQYIPVFYVDVILRWETTFPVIIIHFNLCQLSTTNYPPPPSHAPILSSFLSVCGNSHKINRRSFLLVASTYSWRTAIIFTSTSSDDTRGNRPRALSHTSYLSITRFRVHSRAWNFILSNGVIILSQRENIPDRAMTDVLCY